MYRNNRNNKTSKTYGTLEPADHVKLVELLVQTFKNL